MICPGMTHIVAKATTTMVSLPLNLRCNFTKNSRASPNNIDICIICMYDMYV